MNRCLYVLTMTLLMALTAMAGETERRELHVGDFTSLHVVDNLHVVYRSNADSAGTAVVEAAPEVLRGLIFNNNTKGKLSVQATAAVLTGGALPIITVYSTSLTDAHNAGDSLLVLEQVKAGDKLLVRLSDNGGILVKDVHATTLDLNILTGHGTIEASGSCDKLNIRLIGTGRIDALHVKAQDLFCRLVGTGTIVCDAHKIPLAVRGSGTGTVQYRGTPTEVKVNKLGPLKVVPLED